jgi:hypothetical protein
MRIVNRTDPVYFPNSKGGPQADSERYEPASWYADGEIMRAAYVEHAEDDDWSQPGALVREVMDDAARKRLVSNIVGALFAGVTEPVLERAFSYLRNVDKNLGDEVEAGRPRRTALGPAGMAHPRHKSDHPMAVQKRFEVVDLALLDGAREATAPQVAPKTDQPRPAPKSVATLTDPHDGCRSYFAIAC